MSEKKEKKERISSIEAMLMIGVALVIDLVQAFLEFILVGIVLNPFISIFAALTFWFWFHAKGVSFMSGKKIATSSVSALIEIFPILGGLPALTVGVLAMVSIVKTEDKLGIKLPLQKTSSTNN